MNLAKKLAPIFAAICIFAQANIQAEIKVKEAKNLYNILKEDYKHLSPIEGMVWWKTNILENLYSLGDDNHATVKLIRVLFHLHDDGIFDCTRPTNITPGITPGNAAAYFTPTIIAELIYLLETNNTREDLEKLKATISSTKYVNSFISKYADLFPKEGRFKKNLKRIFKLICDSCKESLANNSQTNCSLTDKIIYKESLVNNSQASYLPYTTQKILLAFMWKKSGSKQDFIEYFNCLNKDLEIIESKWDINQKLDEEYSYDEFYKIFSELSSKEPNELLKNYELVICSKLSNFQGLPLVSHLSGVNFRDEQFPDCAEVSLLNFLNQVLFNYDTKCFDISLIEKNGAKVHPSLKLFYDKNPTIDCMQTKKVNDDWALVVSDIPDVTYILPKSETYKYCEIETKEGKQQILKVLNYLLGVNSFEELWKICSRENFKLTVENIESNKDPKLGSFIISVNGMPKFEWNFRTNHFTFNCLKEDSDSSAISIDRLLILWDSAIDNLKVHSLLVLSQSKFIIKDLYKSDKSANLSNALLNFILMIPKLKNADVNIDFITFLLEKYNYLNIFASPEQTNFVIDFCRKAYYSLPNDFVYFWMISKEITNNKVQELYSLIQSEFDRYVLQGHTKISMYEHIISDILANKIKELYNIVENKGEELLAKVTYNSLFLESHLRRFLEAEDSLINNIAIKFLNIKTFTNFCNVILRIQVSELSRKFWWDTLLKSFESFDLEEQWILYYASEDMLQDMANNLPVGIAENFKEKLAKLNSSELMQHIEFGLPFNIIDISKDSI